MTPTTKCPVCGKTVANETGEMKHLMCCGVVFDIYQCYHCLCGAVINGPGKTFAEDYNEHVQKVQHDWPKLLTQRALEEM